MATSDGEVIGHLQLTGTGDPRQAEIKNMAVRENRQGHGVGRRLIQAAIDLAAAEGLRLILVATAAADIGNLRFTSGRASGCGPSSGTPSPPPPAIRRAFSSTASS